MIPGNSVQDANPACRPEPDDASRTGAAAGYDTPDGPGKPARPPWAYRRPLQDIQDIVDKLAAVTQQLRGPGGSGPGSSRLAPDPPVQLPRLRSRRALSAPLRADARSSVNALR